MNLKKEKIVALQAAKTASKILLHYFGKKEFVREKSNKTLVAEGDLESNKAIIKIIKKNFPTHSILSEETGFEDNKSDFKWVIDPLDGTHNFLHKIPIFGISIALEYKNETVLGVMHFPVLCMTAVAEKNKGAFLNRKKLKVSDKKILDHAFVLVDYSYSTRNQMAKILRSFSKKSVDIRNFGAAVYNLLMIASGKAEGYIILSTNEWDVAAGFLIIEEAGGKITDSDGKKYSFNQKKFMASNGKVHKELIRYLY